MFLYIYIRFFHTFVPYAYMGLCSYIYIYRSLLTCTYVSFHIFTSLCIFCHQQHTIDPQYPNTQAYLHNRVVLMKKYKKRCEHVKRDVYIHMKRDLWYRPTIPQYTGIYTYVSSTRFFHMHIWVSAHIYISIGLFSYIYTSLFTYSRLFVYFVINNTR